MTDALTTPTLPTQDQVREQIKLASRDQSHIGRLEYPTVSATLRNPFCGDEIEVGVCFDDQGVVREARALVRGCLVAKAAWSIVAPQLIGLERGAAIGLLNQIQSELGDSKSKPAFTALKAPLTTLLAYKLPSPRSSCATLGSDAALKALQINS